MPCQPAHAMLSQKNANAPIRPILPIKQNSNLFKTGKEIVNK
jgi:hypothetical protein